MWWDITSLVQNVNLIRAKKSITPIGLNIFFCVNRGTTGKIFKTYFGLSEQVWMDERNYKFAFQISKQCFTAFVVEISKLSPLNIWRILNQFRVV